MKKLIMTCAAVLGLSVSALAGTYTKVTADQVNWTGEYLIVYENGETGYAMDGSLDNPDATTNFFEVSLGEGKIVGDYDGSLFTVSPKTGGYSILSTSEKYIGSSTTGNSGNLKSSTTDDFTNVISWTNGHVQIKSADKFYLIYNTSSKKFRYYTSESTNTQFYKKEGGSTTNPAASVTLNASTITRNQYERFALQATVVGEDATKPCTEVMSWSSSDVTVAEVDAAGVVTTKKNGTAVIKVKVGDKEASCIMTVNAVAGYVLTFPALDEQPAISQYNQTWVAKMCGLDWTVVYFSNNGNKWDYVRAQASTEPATITTSEVAKIITGVAVTLDAATSGVSLTVVGADDAAMTENIQNYPMTMPSGGAGVATTAVGAHKYYQLQAKVPTNPTGKEMKISRVELMVGGAVPTTPTWVNSVVLNVTNAEIEEGATRNLTATISPSTAANKAMTWKSSNESVATVANGVVTAVKAGKAVITVTTTDGGYTATCNVTVKEKSVTPDPDPDPEPEPEDDPAGTKYTATFTNKDWANAEGLWTGIVSGSAYQSGQGVQILGSIVGAGVESVDEYTEVNGVRLNYCTNKSSGSGKLQVKVGENTIHEVELNSTGGTTLRDVTIPITPAEAGKIKVTIANPANSLYINSLTVFGTKKEKEVPTPPTEGVSGKKYARVMTAPEDWKGTYLIYCGGKSVAMNGAVASGSIASDAGLSITEPYLLGDTIYATPDMDDATFLIDSYDGMYSVKSVKNGYYLGIQSQSSSGLNDIKTEPGATNKMQIALTTGGDVTITAVNNDNQASLQYNSSSAFFRYYKSAQTAIQLYKLTNEVVEKVSLTAITLSETELALETEGGKTTETLTVSYEPTNADVTSLVWASSNTDVATVVNGVVTAKKAGTATITATANSLGQEYKATCTVTVTTYDPFAGKETYKKVTSAAGLFSGDTIVLVCEAQHRANGEWEATEAPAGRLVSEEVIAQDGKCYSAYAQDIRLEKEGTAWKMVIRYYGDDEIVGEEKALRCAAVKSLEVKGEGCQTWNISFTDGNAIITSTKSGNDYGTLQYNSGAKVFSMYTSEQQPIQIYRKDREVIATGVENVTIIKTGIRYNILGQVVDESYRGIVIVDGQKRLQ